MPRAQFYADLAQVTSGPSMPGISNVQVGNEDGLVEFNYTRPDCPSVAIKIEIAINGNVIHRLLPDRHILNNILDTFLYRLRHRFYVYATSVVDVPDGVGSALDRITQASAGLTISELLCSVAMELDQLFPAPDTDQVSELASLYIRLDLG